MSVASIALLALTAPPVLQQAWPPHPPVFPDYLLGVDDVGHVLSVDMDGDGHLDLLTRGSSLRVHLGTGKGSFLRNALPPVPVTPKITLGGSVAADFDGDGDLDVALIGDLINEGRLYTYLNDGSGALTLHTTMTFQKSGEKLSAADFDGDGWVDLFLGRKPGPKVMLLRSMGPAGFAGQQSIQPPMGWSGVRDYAVADVTGDGRPDVLSLNWGASTTAFLYANDGAGWFHPPVPVFEFGLYAQCLLLADLRGDGVLHAGVVDSPYAQSPTFYWYENDGSGHFEFRQRIEGVEFPPGEPRDLAVRDMDGDGRQEWIVKLPSDTLARIVAKGPDAVVAPGEIVLPSGSWRGAGDFDSDGAEDLLSVSYPMTFPANLALSRGDGAGGLVAKMVSVTEQGWLTPHLFDIDGDGRLDVVVRDYIGKALHLHRGLGDGGFEWIGTVHTRDRPLDVAVGDFDGDGRQDLGVIEGMQSFVELLLQESEWAFSSVGTTPPDSTPYAFPYGPSHVLDSDGDGRDELALMDVVASRILVVGLRPASTQILAAIDLPDLRGINGVTSPDPQGVQALELIAPGTSTYLSLWVLGQPLSVPPPTLVERLELPLQPLAPGVQLAFDPLVRDQDGDGLMDVWATHRTADWWSTTSASVWHGLSSGGFGAPDSDRSDSVLFPSWAEDVDGDGFADRGYLYGPPNTDFPYPIGLQVHRPALGSSLAESETYAWLTHALGDVDGDGRPDLVVIRDGRILSLLNQMGL